MKRENDSFEKSFSDAALGLRPFDEFIWFGVDDVGNLGCFITGGIGLVPSAVFADREKYFRVRQIYESLPKNGTAVCTKFGYVTDLFSIGWAERGFFVYEWLNKTGDLEIDAPYQLWVTPNTCLKINDLDVATREWMCQFHIGKGVNFEMEVYIRRSFEKFNC